MVHSRIPGEPENAAIMRDDKLVPLLLFALGSVRLALGLHHREVFGVEATIALFVTLFAASALFRSDHPA